MNYCKNCNCHECVNTAHLKAQVKEYLNSDRFEFRNFLEDHQLNGYCPFCSSDTFYFNKKRAVCCGCQGKWDAIAWLMVKNSMGLLEAMNYLLDSSKEF